MGGRATRFRITLTNALDKNKTYYLSYKDVSILLDLDNNAPLISYTNKVRNDSSKYNETDNIYLVKKEIQNIFEAMFSKKETFDISTYLRLNVIDDRDGSLLDETKFENIPNLYEKGVYNVKVKATDSWGNTAEETFTFEVIENNDKTDLLINVGSITLVVLLLGSVGIIFYKKQSKKE